MPQLFIGAVMKLLCELYDLINEGVLDAGKLKAVCVIGGPASGKTTLGKYIKSKLPLHGIKLMDTDVMYQHLSQKHDIDISAETSSKMSLLTYKVGTEKTYKQTSNWVDGMLPLILLSTGSNISRTTHQIDALKNIGYDVCVIFVYIDNLDKVIKYEQERAAQTGRKVDVEWFKKYYENQENILTALSSKYPVYTTSHFTIRDVADNEILVSSIERFYNKPVQNIVGKKLLADLEQQKGKYVSDIPHMQPHVANIQNFDRLHQK